MASSLPLHSGEPPIDGVFDVSIKQEQYQVKDGKLFIGGTECVVRKGGVAIKDETQLQKLAELFNKTLSQELELGKNEKLVVSDKGIKLLDTKNNKVDAITRQLYAADKAEVKQQCQQLLAALKTESVATRELGPPKQEEPPKPTRESRRGPSIDLSEGAERAATALKGAANKASAALKDVGERAATTLKSTGQRISAKMSDAKDALQTALSKSAKPAQEPTDLLESARAFIEEKEATAGLNTPPALEEVITLEPADTADVAVKDEGEKASSADLISTLTNIGVTFANEDVEGDEEVRTEGEGEEAEVEAADTSVDTHPLEEESAAASESLGPEETGKLMSSLSAIWEQESDEEYGGAEVQKARSKTVLDLKDEMRQLLGPGVNLSKENHVVLGEVEFCREFSTMNTLLGEVLPKIKNPEQEDEVVALLEGLQNAVAELEVVIGTNMAVQNMTDPKELLAMQPNPEGLLNVCQSPEFAKFAEKLVEFTNKYQEIKGHVEEMYASQPNAAADLVLKLSKPMQSGSKVALILRDIGSNASAEAKETYKAAESLATGLAQSTQEAVSHEFYAMQKELNAVVDGFKNGQRLTINTEGKLITKEKGLFGKNAMDVSSKAFGRVYNVIFELQKAGLIIDDDFLKKLLDSPDFKKAANANNKYNLVYNQEPDKSGMGFLDAQLRNKDKQKPPEVKTDVSGELSAG